MQHKVEVRRLALPALREPLARPILNTVLSVGRTVAALYVTFFLTGMSEFVEVVEAFWWDGSVRMLIEAFRKVPITLYFSKRVKGKTRQETE